MDFSTFARSRKSARGYQNKPVPRAVIEEIINTAKYAPSSYNTQTWKIHVLTGDVLDKVRQGNVDNMVAGVPFQRDFPYKEDYAGAHKDRQREVAMQLFDVMDIQRRGTRKSVPIGPCGAFVSLMRRLSLVLTYDKHLEPAAITQFALGSLAYGIVLAAWERGLGCVINGQGIMQSGAVHENANIPEDESIMICIAMGYPDDSFPAK